MRYAHTILVTVFMQEGESLEPAKAGMKSMLPLDFGKEKISISEEKCKGFEEKQILVARLLLSKESHTSLFLKELSGRLNEEQKYTLTHQRNRLDEDMNYYIRLDKPQFLQGNYVLTDEGNCIHIKIHVAAFPKNKDAAGKVVENIFKP